MYAGAFQARNQYLIPVRHQSHGRNCIVNYTCDVRHRLISLSDRVDSQAAIRMTSVYYRLDVVGPDYFNSFSTSN